MLPKSVSVKGCEYKVLVDELPPSLCGVCDKVQKVIIINQAITKDKELTANTFVHEVAHAYFNELHLSVVVPADIEEIICNMTEEIYMSCRSSVDKLLKVKSGRKK